MVTTVSLRRWSAMLAALLAVAVVLAGVPASTARAEPTSPGSEGGSKNLRAALKAASKGYIDAKAKLGASKKRQLQLNLERQKLEARVRDLTAEVGLVAAKSYRMGRLTGVTMLLNSAGPDAFLERAAGLDLMAQRDGKQLRRYLEAREQADRARKAIDREVREQEKQLRVLAKKKQDAERALAVVGGQASMGFLSANSPRARPAPRNSDGSWPRESCTINDPTTSGCLTPRTLHALKQAQAAGFTRHVSCFRGGGGGEHPTGQACDFAASPGGFANVDASGGDRAYGNRLAAFYVHNADGLGVMYVIWYRQIWMPGTGWRTYYGGGGPSGAHTNHVHLSVV